MGNHIEAGEVNKIQIVKSGQEGSNILFLHPAGQPPLGMTEHIAQLGKVGNYEPTKVTDPAIQRVKQQNKFT